MGVMECNRLGCDNIMCQRYSSEFGYLCEECFYEMVDRGLTVGNFMKTKKNDKLHNSFKYDEIFKHVNSEQGKVEKW